MIRNNRLGYGNDKYCTILLHCDEIDFVNLFIESSYGGNGGFGHDVTVPYTTPNIPSLAKLHKFPSYGVTFQGTPDRYAYLNVGGGIQPDWTFADKKYSYETWIRAELPPVDSIADRYISIMGIYVDANNLNLVKLNFDNASLKHQIVYEIIEASVTRISLSYNINIFDDSFHHIAVERNGDTYTLYVDGIVGDSGTYAGTLIALSSKFRFGNMGVNGAIEYVNSIVLDEMRLSTNIARWNRSGSTGEYAFETPDRAY